MSRNVLNLSRLTGTDLEGNIKAVARSFVDWEVAIPKQTKALNGLFRVSQASGASVAQIAEDIQKFGSPLRQLGFSFEEAAAMFASFERAGVNTQTMVPGLKLAISNLTRPTENLAQSMTKLGIEAGKPDLALRQIFDLLGKGSTLSQIQKTGLAMDVFGKRAGADMAEAISQGRFELDQFLRLMERGDTIAKTARDTNDASENFRIFANRLKVLAEPAARAVFNIINRISQILASPFVARALRTMGKVFKVTFDGIAAAVRPMVRGVSAGFRVISDVARGTSKVFRAIVTPIRNALTSVVETVRDRFRKAQIAAVNFVNGIIGVINKIPGVDIGTISLGFGEGSSQRGRAAGLQRGGFLMGGKPSGDSIPAMLERGEYVLNREAVKKIGVKKLNQVNFEAAPRFQKGGRVGMIDGGAVSRLVDHLPGVNAVKGAATLFGKGASYFIDKLPKPDLPEPIKGLGPWIIDQVTEFIKRRVPKFLTGSTALGAAQGQIRQAMQLAISKGLSITSGFPLGTPGVHSPNSYHYQYGRAFDASNGVNTPQMREYAIEAAARWGQNILELFYDPLGWYVKNGSRVSGAIGGHSDHVHTAMQRGGLAKLQKGGFVGNINRRYPEANSAYGNWGGPTLPSYVVAALAQAAGMPGRTMEQVTRGESGAHKKHSARPGATGIDPGGTKGHGLWMITSGYNDDLAAKVGGWGQMLNPVINAWAAAQIYRRQGLRAWYGTGSVTGDGLNYTGKYDIRKALGGYGYQGALYRATGGKLGSKPKGKVGAAADKADKAKEAAKKKAKANRIKKKIARIAARGLNFPGSNKIASLEAAADKAIETIDLFDREATAEWSPAGSDYDQGELSSLISYYQGLLDNYLEQRRLVVAAVKILRARIAFWQAKIQATQNPGGVVVANGQIITPGKKWQVGGWRRAIRNARSTIGTLGEKRVNLEGLTGQGGLIADTQFRLRELGATNTTPPDEAGANDSEIADLLREQLRETQRALAISQAQMPIFQQFMPRFHQGGIVQGPMGAERPVMAQAGEGIFTREQMRAMGSQNITVVIEDAAIDSNRIRVEVDGVIQEKVSTVRRQGSNRRFATK